MTSGIKLAHLDGTDHIPVALIPDLSSLYLGVSAGGRLLFGVGAPSSGTGVNGDSYVNTSNNDFYGPKSGGAWGSPRTQLGSVTDGTITDAKITSGGLSPGSISGTAVITTDTRLGDARTPTNGSVTDAKVAVGAAIDPAKIAGTAVVTADSRLTNARTPTAHASTHAFGGSDLLLPSDILAADTLGFDLATGDESFARQWIGGSGSAPGNQIERFGYFTCSRSFTCTQVKMWSGNTAAVTTTLCRLGIYTIGSSPKDLTMVASTPSDTALFAAINTPYTKSLSASYAFVRGTRYAFGLLWVGSTSPTVCGMNLVSAASSAFSADPRMCGQRTGQSDLLSTATEAAMVDSNQVPYVQFLP